MRLQLTRAALGPALSAALALGSSAVARADEVSGTWTGRIELLGNYYWEPSTRVAAPELRARLDAPSGLRVSGAYLVDAITSASQATGVQVDRSFTEVRHQGELGVGGEVDLGDVQVELTASARGSLEPDYRALAANLTSAWFFADRATTLFVQARYFHDRVGRVLRFAEDSPDGGPGGMMTDHPGDIDGVNASIGIEQVMTPRLVLSARYELAHLEGFLANPYRKVVVGGQPLPEVHPRARLRHALFGRLVAASPSTGTTLHGHLTLYADSWEIFAIDPEVRVYQRLADLALVRVRYMLHAQTGAYFYEDGGRYDAVADAMTFDPKMAPATEHELGFMLALRLPFLEEQRWDARVALSFDYVWRSTRFGDGMIGQASLALPF